MTKATEARRDISRKNEARPDARPMRFPTSSSCAEHQCVCSIVIVGNVFTIYRCAICGQEEWL